MQRENEVDTMLEMYSEEELNVLEKHIENCFGSFRNVLHEIASPDIHVDVCIVEPTPERNYYTLVTMGMGAHFMSVPEELAEYRLERAELVISLPAHWKIDSSEEEWFWPIGWLKMLARLPVAEDSWLGWGHTVANPGGVPFAANTGLSGSILLSPGQFPQEASVCRLPDGDEINFYAVVPLYAEEMEFKCRNGADALMELFGEGEDAIPPLPLDPERKNVCAESKKQYRIKPEDIKPLLTDWDGPEGCLATDRITVDGCPVGYCYRQRPDAGDDLWDSGWRFTAGDESDEYMDDPEHSGIFSLNSICNADPEIMPLLRAPYGSAFYRDENGAFCQAEPWDEACGNGEDCGEGTCVEEEKAESRGMGERTVSGPRKFLLGEEDMAVLESLEDDSSGYYGQMLGYLDEFLKRGVEEGRFTETEAGEALDIALWYSYACNNLDDYDHYYMTTQWMPPSEKNAGGCGTWYYRYSCALMYCSRLEEALEYAEKGLMEEPDYPWGYLQAAKLRCHFGDKEGALAAVEHGLELVPGDFEFLTLKREIGEGRTLEDMEYHYISPENDRQLQEGELSDSTGKLRAIAGIRCDQKGLTRIKELFESYGWTADSPYCTFFFKVRCTELEGMFRMNEAALSKLDYSRLWAQKESVTQEDNMIRKGKDGSVYQLCGVIFEGDYSAELIYCQEGSDRTMQVRVPPMRLN